MIINGSLILLLFGVWVAYKLACWAGEPPRATNREDGSRG